MFPSTYRLDRIIGGMKSRGLTPKTSPALRDFMIAQAAPWFPGTEKVKLAEEHLIERGIIPAKSKKKNR